MGHDNKIVREGELWSVYWWMIAGAFFWGSLLSLLAWKLMRFNHHALMFLGFMTITSSLCLGFTVYFRLRLIVARAVARFQDRELELRPYD